MKYLTALIAIVIAVASTQSASALPPFKKAFAEKYAAKHKSKEFQAAVKKASCNACHVKGAKKDVQNEYGKVLNKLIEGDAKDRISAAGKKGAEEKKKESEKVMAELEKAFGKSFEMKSAAGKGPKYGELIKEGKLPVDLAKAEAAYKAEQKKKAAGKTADKSAE